MKEIQYPFHSTRSPVELKGRLEGKTKKDGEILWMLTNGFSILDENEDIKKSLTEEIFKRAIAKKWQNSNRLNG